MEKTYNFRHLDWNIFKLLFRYRFADFSRLCQLQRGLICGKMIVRKLLHCLVLPLFPKMQFGLLPLSSLVFATTFIRIG